jgi:hypothetical protein
MSGGSAGSAAGGGTGIACTDNTTCPTGGYCKVEIQQCLCPSDMNDVCTSACVSRQTDGNNCGTCGTKCPAGAACAAGQCAVAPTELTKGTGCGSMRLAIQGANIYWTEAMSGKVMTMPLAGGAATAVATGQLTPTQIAADAGGVYWVNQGDGTAASSKVYKVVLPLVATPVPVVLKASTDMTKILAITVAAGKLYYALAHDVHAISTDPAVTADVVVGTAANYDKTPPEPDGEPAGIAVSGTALFWTTESRNGVEGDDTAVGVLAYKELGESQGALVKPDIATDGTHVYWADGYRIKTAMASKEDQMALAGTPESLSITSFGTGATDVYIAAEKIAETVVANRIGQIFKHSLAAADSAVPSKAIARDQNDVTAVITDATHVYWATQAECAIRSAPL